MNLCNYSNIFGKPKEGIHSYRIFNIAIVDLGVTILLSKIISYAYNLNSLIVFLSLLVIGIISHKLFCVNTTLNSIIFRNMNKN